MADSVEAGDLSQELTPRQKEILKLLVLEYVSTAVPVGSSAIARRYAGRVSSATVRNELSVLAETGFIVQPHTSAGRIPTDKGYRYFVENLMVEVDLSLSEQRMIRHQFYQVHQQQEQWSKLAAAVLAHMSRAVSLVTAPRQRLAHFRHLELVSISDTRGLMVLVLQDGTIRQEVIPLTRPTSQDDLSRTAQKLNTLLQGLTAGEMRSEPLRGMQSVPLSELEGSVLSRILTIMAAVDRVAGTEIYRDGLINVLSQPEFAESERFCRIVETLERRSLLESIIEEMLSASGVQVIIGGESRWREMEDLSLILSRYGVNGEASGVLGVMGPTRMRYGRAISAVRYVARLLTGLVEEVYGY